MKKFYCELQGKPKVVEERKSPLRMPHGPVVYRVYTVMAWNHWISFSDQFPYNRRDAGQEVGLYAWLGWRLVCEKAFYFYVEIKNGASSWEIRKSYVRLWHKKIEGRCQKNRLTGIERRCWCDSGNSGGQEWGEVRERRQEMVCILIGPWRVWIHF